LYITCQPAYNKGINILDSIKVDRSAFSVASLDDPSDDKAYWLSKTPQEKLEAVELMRQILYGYDPDTLRIQKVIEVVQLKERSYFFSIF
jgi:hypothetical protein